MTPRRRLPRSRTAAFTLMETLLAIALLASLLAAVNIFIFSMGELWGRNGDRRLFDQHVRAVTRHVSDLLREGSLPTSIDPAAASPISFQPVQLSGGLPETSLTFDLPASPRLATWPEQALPDVVCSLVFRDRQGLFLGYHSRLETHFREDPVRLVPISSFVSEIDYEYYQPEFKSWQTRTTPQRDAQGQWPLPVRLRLKFKHGTLAAETVILLPIANTGAPLY